MNYNLALVQLPLVREAPGATIRTPQEAYHACKDIAELAQEAFHVLSLDVKSRLINRHLVTLGLIDSSLVHGREVFRPAILDGAASILLVHNHPSGDPTPSAEDYRITRQLIEVGKVLEIPVLDHLIIGRPEAGRPAFCSLRENGGCAFAQ